MCKLYILTLELLLVICISSHLFFTSFFFLFRKVIWVTWFELEPIIIYLIEINENFFSLIRWHFT